MCAALVARAPNPEMIFLTGDLGFQALEPLQAVLGERFINAGVAEQNMVTVAAALARQHFEVWVYSIAPFCYARPFEQIRNDIALHDLPVTLIGNGGGYGYGVQGPTHHAIEDYGVLLTLPQMRVFAPVFDEDVEAVIGLAGTSAHPAYVRLGRDERPRGFVVPPYAPWRQLTQGGGVTVVAVGPLAGSYLEAFNTLPEDRRPNLWALGELPIEETPPPPELLAQIANGARLCVAEEHVSQGGAAAQLALHLASHGIASRAFTSMHARAHVYERSGSQNYLRVQSRLDVASMLSIVHA
jgi:transketolase